MITDRCLYVEKAANISLHSCVPGDHGSAAAIALNPSSAGTDRVFDYVQDTAAPPATTRTRFSREEIAGAVARDDQDAGDEKCRH